MKPRPKIGIVHTLVNGYMPVPQPRLKVRKRHSSSEIELNPAFAAGTPTGDQPQLHRPKLEKHILRADVPMNDLSPQMPEEGNGSRHVPHPHDRLKLQPRH
jgi:hypothetical protein